MKLINNAVIMKCNNCSLSFITSNNRFTCSGLDLKDVNPDTIDPSCPLQDCFIIKQVIGEKATIDLLKDWGVLEAKDLDYVILVKKTEAE